MISRPDPSFWATSEDVGKRLDISLPIGAADLSRLPAQLPETGLGEARALDLLGPIVQYGAVDLGSETAFAHMDPPTPWITWVAAYWNAALNQNLLHDQTSPSARPLEDQVVQWLCPYFGADGGLVVPGSTIANLTALWAARELHGITEVVASADAHVSISKSANILGIKYRTVPVNPNRRINEGLLGDLSSAALVLTAGTTSSGAIDPLFAGQNARWRHIDAAWAGPLRLTNTHRHLLDGIEQADSVSISAHKLLFQPKESAVVLFRSFSNVSEALSFGGPYLVKPNVGLLGSHGAAGVPLLAMLLAWGREGLASRLDSCMKAADDLAALLAEDSKYQIFSAPITGVVLWRPRSLPFEEAKRLLEGISISTAVIDGEVWFRCVASNPMVSARTYFDSIHSRLRHI